MATQRTGMNPNEQEQQQNVESGRAPVHAEEHTYQVVFRAAAQPPPLALAPGFADRVMQRLTARQLADGRREWTWLIAGMVVMVLAALVSMVLTGFRFNLTFLDPVKGLVLMGIGMAFLFHWIDRKWIRPTSV